MNDVKKISLFIFKVLSALCFSYVLALIVREFIVYGLFSFVFLILSISMAFFYLVRDMKFLGILVLNISLILFAFLLRFYVILAYGS